MSLYTDKNNLIRFDCFQYDLYRILHMKQCYLYDTSVISLGIILYCVYTGYRLSQMCNATGRVAAQYYL